MSKRVQSITGILLMLMGATWTGQGLGFIPGSFMTGSTTWAIVGPVVAGCGALLTFNARRAP